MNAIRKHVPGFCDFEAPPPMVEFETTAELLAVDFVAEEGKSANFHRFSLSGNLLMVELHGGRQWWVVGYINDPASVDLPEWKPVA